MLRRSARLVSAQAARPITAQPIRRASVKAGGKKRSAAATEFPTAEPNPTSTAKKSKKASTKKASTKASAPKAATVGGSIFKHGTLDRGMEDAAAANGFKYIVGTDEGQMPLSLRAFAP
jgi:hypothetical protein